MCREGSLGAKAVWRRGKEKGKQNPVSGMACEGRLTPLGSLQFRLSRGPTPGRAKVPGSSAGLGLGSGGAVALRSRSCRQEKRKKQSEGLRRVHKWGREIGTRRRPPPRSPARSLAAEVRARGCRQEHPFFGALVLTAPVHAQNACLGVYTNSNLLARDSPGTSDLSKVVISAPSVPPPAHHELSFMCLFGFELQL